MLDDLIERRSGPGQAFGKPVHLGELAIADDETLLRVEHAQTVRHVVQGGVESAHLFGERVFRVHAFGDVLVGRDPAAAGHRAVDDPDRVFSIDDRVKRRGFALGKNRVAMTEHLVRGLAGMTADAAAILDHLPQARAGTRDMHREREQVAIILIAGDEAELARRTCTGLAPCC